MSSDRVRSTDQLEKAPQKIANTAVNEALQGFQTLARDVAKTNIAAGGSIDLSQHNLYGDNLPQPGQHMPPALARTDAQHVAPPPGDAAHTTRARSFQQDNAILPPARDVTNHGQPHARSFQADNAILPPRPHDATHHTATDTQSHTRAGHTQRFGQGHDQPQQINRDAAPSEHTVQKGDSLWKIAKQHLGPDASNQEILKHVKEIAAANGMKNMDQVIQPGDHLKLPGHTKDGGYVTQDAQGNKHTKMPDGSERTDNKDGSGQIRRADGSTQTWGKPGDAQGGQGGQGQGQGQGDNGQQGKPGDNTQQGKPGDNTQQGKPGDNTQQGKPGDSGTKPGDRQTDKPADPGSDTNTQVRQALEEQLQAKVKDGSMSDREYQRFHRDMDKLDERVKKGEISQEQENKIYQQEQKLLSTESTVKDASGRQVVSEKDRVHLAHDIMFHAAHPYACDQGRYNTCNVTTVGEHLYAKDPARAAEMVTSTALNGSWTAPDGKQIKIDPGSLVAQNDAADAHTRDGHRSYGTQILNNVLVNDITQRRNPPEFYNQIAPNVRPDPAHPEGTATRPALNGDTGERLVDANGNEVKKGNPPQNARQPWVFSSDMQNEITRLTGEKNVVIADKSMDNSPNLVHVNSPQEMADMLKKAKQEGRMPLIVEVDVHNPPWNDTGAGSGAHVVTIRDFNPQTGKVDVVNQWGENSDKSIPVDELYRATKEWKPGQQQQRQDNGGFRTMSDTIDGTFDDIFKGSDRMRTRGIQQDHGRDHDEYHKSAPPIQ